MRDAPAYRPASGALRLSWQPPGQPFPRHLPRGVTGRDLDHNQGGSLTRHANGDGAASRTHLQHRLIAEGLALAGRFEHRLDRLEEFGGKERLGQEA